MPFFAGRPQQVAAGWPSARATGRGTIAVIGGLRSMEWTAIADKCELGQMLSL
jgi:hypothetical protein